MYRIFSLWAVAAIMAVQGCILGCAVEGLHSANPKTTFRFNPWSRSIEFSDNKDNDVKIVELTFNTETKAMTLKGLEIINNASGVRAANREQLEGLAIQADAIGKAWASGIQAGAQLAQALVGGTPATQPAGVSP